MIERKLVEMWFARKKFKIKITRRVIWNQNYKSLIRKWFEIKITNHLSESDFKSKLKITYQKVIWNQNYKSLIRMWFESKLQIPYQKVIWNQNYNSLIRKWFEIKITKSDFKSRFQIICFQIIFITGQRTRIRSNIISAKSLCHAFPTCFISTLSNVGSYSVVYVDSMATALYEYIIQFFIARSAYEHAIVVFYRLILCERIRKIITHYVHVYLSVSV